jgi:hypothetical protein
MHTYDTVSEAINDLRKRGYTEDFNLGMDTLTCGEIKCRPEDFDITEIYRFEGNTDPADEAIVFAIESKVNNIKGVLVNGYGISNDSLSAAMIKKLSTHLNN